MAPAIPRLKRRPEFLRVAGAGRKGVAPGLIVQARSWRRGETPTAGAAPLMRVGFTASRKVGNAVARNRVRRRLRAVVERVLEAHAAPGHDFVVIGRGATLTRPFAALVKDMEMALKKLGTWRDQEAPPPTEETNGR